MPDDRPFVKFLAEQANIVFPPITPSSYFPRLGDLTSPEESTFCPSSPRNPTSSESNPIAKSRESNPSELQTAFLILTPPLQLPSVSAALHQHRKCSQWDLDRGSIAACHSIAGVSREYDAGRVGECPLHVRADLARVDKAAVLLFLF